MTNVAPKEVPQPASGDALEWFTVVFRGLTNEERRELVAHKKGAIFSYSNAIADRDDALAASGAPQEVPGDAPDLRLVMCPACFVEVTRADADQQTLDARRWNWVRHHWSNVRMSWNRDQTLKAITLTLKGEHYTPDAEAIEREIDAAMKGPQ